MSSFSWEQCIICQKNTKEALRCPKKAYSFDANTYKVFLDSVLEFKTLDSLPVQPCFDIDNITADELVQNEAKWHKSCHIKFALSKLQKAKERGTYHSVTNEDDIEPRRTSKRVLGAIDSFDDMCIFCNDGKIKGALHRFSTDDASNNLKRMVLDLEDFDVLAKISGGVDLIAIEAKYHMQCLTNLRNRHKSLLRKRSKDKTVLEAEEAAKINETRAFIELIDFIEMSVENGTNFFVVAELHAMYELRLKSLGLEKTVNRFRLKNELLNHFSEAQEESDGRRSVLVFKEGLKQFLCEAFKERDYSEDTNILAKAAKILRKDIFSHTPFKFEGSFPTGCQASSLPETLKSFISMVLNGLDLNVQEEDAQPCLTIGQGIVFNTKKKGAKKNEGNQKKVRHSAQREPPLPIYLGLNIHASLRNKTLINKLYRLGLSISYDRVIEIEDLVAKSIIERSMIEGCVAPLKLKKNLFTVAGLDNIDHNPSSTTCNSSFHGTAISLFQFPKYNNPGEIREEVGSLDSRQESHSLPDSFTVVPQTELSTTCIKVPLRDQEAFKSSISENIRREDLWISSSLTTINQQSELTSENPITWAAYHSQSDQSTEPPSVTALLPMFNEKAASPAMIKHGMTVVKQSIDFLNHDQIPVIAMDQPLFAIAKMVQWKWPEIYGEDHFVIMFGGLHLEMALWNTLGDLLESSGWCAALTEAEVASPGIAESFVKATHLKRTR